MKEIFSRFIKRIVILTAILIGISIVLFFVMPANKFSIATPFIALFFCVVTGGLYYILLKSAENKFSRFVNQFMIITFAKLFLYVIIIAGYSFLRKTDAIPFIIAFFILYLIYTIFELWSFLNDQKKMRGQG